MSELLLVWIGITALSTFLSMIGLLMGVLEGFKSLEFKRTAIWFASSVVILSVLVTLI